jgi:hypothetical protein
MTLITKLHLVALAAGIFTTSAIAGPGGNSPKDFPRKIATKEEAMECCVPKAKVAIACTDCKALDVKGGEDKKGITAWFEPDSKHDCSGCGGKITVTQGEKKGATATYKHVCSKCGPDSAYVCTDHKKS